MTTAETVGKTLEMMPESLVNGRTGSPPEDISPRLSVDQVYRAHADFVWACLQRFGIRDRDLDDVLQEVFVVVQKRLPTFRGEARMTTWLYAICLRVASSQRRRIRARPELAADPISDAPGDESDSPEEALAMRERQRVLETILDDLDIEKRALIVMFEIDELSCEEIASMLGLPLGTVWSRLHGARKSFDKAVARFRARAKRGAR